MPTAPYTENYYELHDSFDPTARLSVLWERPTVDYQDGEMIRPLSGPRTRLIIEGEAEFVQRLFEATADTLKEIRAEIEKEQAA